MKHSLCLGVIYLLIAISSVHSASYLYRSGREVVVPSVNDEVKEIVSELKKDEAPIGAVEIVYLTVPVVGPVVSENVEQAVAAKNVPAVENNLIAAVADDVRIAAVDAVAAPVQPAVPSQVLSEEARAKPNPAIRFDELEVIQSGAGKSEKVQTVADTVKSAAVQAIEKQNEEIEKAKPVVEPVKEVVPVVKAVPEEVPSPVKSIDVVQAPEQAVVPVVKDDSVVAPVVAAVPIVEAEKLVESVRSAEPEPVKKVEVPDQKVQAEKVEPEKVEPVPASSPERQESAGANQPPNPIMQIQSTLNQITTNFQNALNGIIANTPFGNRPQSDTPAPANAVLNTNEIASNAANPPAAQAAAPSPTTSAPNLLANVINNFNNLATSILPRPTPAPAVEAAAPQQTQAQTGTRGDQATQAVVQATTQAPNLISNIATNVQNALNNIATGLFQRTTAATTVAPAVASSPAPNVVKGTRVDEEEVEVVQNIDIVNDKIDLTKKGQ